MSININEHSQCAEDNWGSLYYTIITNIIKERNYKIGVEIGVAFGGHCDYILKNTNIDKLYAIDSYEYYPESTDGFSWNQVAYSQADYDNLYEFTLNRLSIYNNRIELIRKRSTDDSIVIPQNIDFVFIDGLHTYDGVKSDIEKYFPLIKEGGLLSGHDYSQSFPGVVRAVDEFVNQSGLELAVENSVWTLTKKNKTDDYYKIEGAKNNDPNPCFKNLDTYPNFNLELEQYKNNLIEMVNAKQSKTFYKFGDGDYYFLKQNPIGSAAPGKRALSVNYNQINHHEYVDGVLKNDFITVEIYPENRQMFHEIFPNQTIHYLAESGYGLVANKWFFKTFKGKIGLIGGHEKIKLIQELMKNEQYQEYLGIDKFNDYLYIPEKFSCDNINATEELIGNQLKNSTSDIFLIGIGNVKNALTHRFKKYKDAVYVDVGGGINAIAGVVSHNRPYSADWINYRLTNYNYESVDQMDYFDTSGINELYI